MNTHAWSGHRIHVQFNKTMTPLTSKEALIGVMKIFAGGENWTTFIIWNAGENALKHLTTGREQKEFASVPPHTCPYFCHGRYIVSL